MSQVLNTMRNVNKFPQYNLFRYMCNYNKDIVKVNASGPDFLLQNLRNASSPKNVLGIISNHYDIMNSKHSMQALRSLFELQKCGATDISMNDILRHPDFTRLCKRLKSHSGVIEINEIVEALKIMTYMGVPSASVITQVLLQLIRQNINSLSLNHIMFVEFLLKQLKSCPLVEALKIALPIVFEINLPLKMEKDNLMHLTEYLHHVSRSNVSPQTEQIIISALNDYRGDFDAKTAKSILWSLSDLECDKRNQPLLEKAVKSFVIHMEDLNYNEIETTITKLIHKYSSKYPFYFNELLTDTFVNYLIDHNFDFKTCSYALRKLIRVNYWNKHLIDYMCKKIVEEPSILVNGDLMDIYALVITISMTNYRPKQWEFIQQLIIDFKSLSSSEKSEILWLKFGASLCLLNIFKEDVLRKCLNELYLDSLFSKKFLYMSDVEAFFSIWHSLTLYKKEFLQIVPSKYNPENLIPKIKDIEDFPLEGALIKALGGEQYVMTHLYSKLGHQIEHAILFRKGGFPVSVNNRPKFIEDIDIPQDHQLVCIFCIKPVLYTINNKQLRSSVTLSIKILEENGYGVVPVSFETWENLNDFEKIPYLMQAIKAKVDSDTSSSSQSVIL